MVVKHNSLISVCIVVAVCIYVIPRELGEMSPLIWLAILIQILVAAIFYKTPYFEVSESRVMLLGLFGKFAYGDEPGATIIVEDDCVYVKNNDGRKKKVPIFHLFSDKDDWEKMKQMFS